MNEKGSLHIITSDDNKIKNYNEEFTDKDPMVNNHPNSLIKFIFNNGLCYLYEKYSRNEYRNLSDMELLYPLVKIGFVVIIGICNFLFVYLPQEFTEKQGKELIDLISEKAKNNIKIGIQQLANNNETFVTLIPEMKADENCIKYIENLYKSSPSKLKMRVLKDDTNNN